MPIQKLEHNFTSLLANPIKIKIRFPHLLVFFCLAATAI